MPGYELVIYDTASKMQLGVGYVPVRAVMFYLSRLITSLYAFSCWKLYSSVWYWPRSLQDQAWRLKDTDDLSSFSNHASFDFLYSDKVENELSEYLYTLKMGGIICVSFSEQTTRLAIDIMQKLTPIYILLACSSAAWNIYSMEHTFSKRSFKQVHQFKFVRETT